ncbi:hypothetical protein [Pseudoalteromonas tunicata]|jgi:hypothetical protein|uniref:Uncharacterized protein n=1 Tax=Pseudoalteromonas tunicata D2 TaxID=87626 RepID=A4C8T7_9GAMM|nr:hypothetical protein [Pseudoalteromonas tunicata]ATC93505.1 hypothetical protein PTUN_a0767 [Pseudoalteromonas tunicata]AXT32544.1 hypothetical protein D1819_18040 [Pseudoalteromonas tunicata]EAR29002.1 hypothetical protein PTD2_08159 [Pseudoalteromonas tunicata D2]
MSKVIRKLTAEILLSTLKACGHNVFEGETNLNIIGIRHANTKANTFNDAICVLYQQSGEWQLKQYKATTEAGTYWRTNPMNVDGTAVLIAGQHKRLWTLGYHQGKYRALVQHKPVVVLRDNNHDTELDTDVTPQAVLQQGYFGINCHRASATTTSTQVDKWSAGCQVFASPNDFDEFIALCEQSAAKYGPYFTYTLLDQADLKESIDHGV